METKHRLSWSLICFSLIIAIFFCWKLSTDGHWYIKIIIKVIQFCWNVNRWSCMATDFNHQLFNTNKLHFVVLIILQCYILYNIYSNYWAICICLLTSAQYSPQYIKMHQNTSKEYWDHWLWYNIENSKWQPPSRITNGGSIKIQSLIAKLGHCI